MNKRRTFRTLAAVIMLVLGALALWQWRVGSVSAETQVGGAWQRVQRSDSYRFSADIEMTYYPLATVGNIGRFSRTQALYAEGQNDLRNDAMQIAFWGGAVSAADPDSAYQLRVRDGVAEARSADGDWQPADAVDAGFAPGGDFLAFLDVATDIAWLGDEQVNGKLISKYSFAVDSLAYANRLRQLSQARLTRSGELPPGAALALPQHLADMDGRGELWIDSRGLPLRQIVTLDIPAAEGTDYRTTADLDVNFSGYEGSGLALNWQQPLRFGAFWLSRIALPSADVAATNAFLLLATALVLVAIMRPRRRALVLVHGALLAVLLASPLLQATTAHAAAERLTSLRAEQEQAQAAEPSPLATGRPLAIPQPNVPLAAVNLQTGTLDSDGDGLSDEVELLIGTSRFSGDTDLDTLSDYDEVVGFEHNGQMWYGNPLWADSNQDGMIDSLEWDLDIRDRDGDGTPNLYDDDDDGDGVPDRHDLSPLSAGQDNLGQPVLFDAANPLQLSIDGLQPARYTYVHLQLRPSDADHLWYAYNVLNWPQDKKGTMQDWDQKSFFDLCVAGGGSQCRMTPDANGDIKLVPMLEVEINDLSTLPRTANGSLDRALLANYDINVQPSGNGGYFLYAPLNLVEDEITGAKVAFNAQLIYQANARWQPQRVRLSWVVQVLNELYASPEEAEAATADPSAIGQNEQTILHAYYDQFELTGLSVQEEGGVEMAIAFEDPATDNDLAQDDALLHLYTGLESSYLVNRDCDILDNDGNCIGNGQRDITIDVIKQRWNRLGNSGYSERQRWGIPANRLRVETFNFAHTDEATMVAGNQIAPALLADHFTGTAATMPSLLFVRETRFRALNLDTRALADPGIAWSQHNVVISVANADETVTGDIVLSPYHYDATANAWTYQPPRAMVTELEERYPIIEVAENPDDVVLTTGEHVAVVVVYATAVKGSQSVIARHSGTAVSYSQNLQLTGADLNDETLRRVYTEAGQTSRYIVLGMARNYVAMATEANFANWDSMIKRQLAAYVEYVSEYGRKYYGRVEFDLPDVPDQVGHKVNPGDSLGDNVKEVARDHKIAELDAVPARVATMAIIPMMVAGLIASNIRGGETAGQLILASVNATMDVVDAVMQVRSILSYLSSEVNNTVKSILPNLGFYLMSARSAMNSVAFKAGAIGAAIGAAVTWVIFFAAWGSIGLSPDSIEFNNLLASTISATVVIIATFLVSLTVVGAIVLAVIAVFDLIALIICKAGVKAVCALGFTDAIIRLLSEWIYTGEVMIDTSGDPPITNVADARMQLTNPALGLVAGNSVRFELDLFSRVQHATPKPSVVLNYPEFYTPADLNSTTVRYSLDDQKRDIPTELNQSGWSFIRMYKIAYRQAPAPVVGWLAPSARRVELYSGTRNDTVVSRVYQLPEAKINVTLPLYLNTGMALPRYDCWFSVCKHKSVKSTTNMDFGQNFILDVLPATLDGFVHWSELGPQIDADGDGVPAYLDPDPTTWDADGDGVPDGFELQNVMNPRAADGDNDGLNDADELRNGSDPKAADTDSDGLSDGEEVNGYMLTLAGVAVHVTSDPLLRDTDTDGMSDGIERLLNALNPASYPFNPRVFNESPLRLYQSMSDGDRVLAIGAQMTYTATVFNGTDVEDELLSTGSYNAALPVELGSATATRSFTLLPGFSDEIVLNGTAAAGERYVAISVGASADIMPFGGSGRAIDATFTDIILNDALPVTIDNDDPDDPELTLGAFVQPNSYVVIGGTASDPTSYIRQVEVSVAGGPFAPASGTSLWAFGLDIPDQADGSVAVQVRATDAVGHTRTKAFDLTIDGTPPDVAIDLAENAIRTVRRNADGDWTLALSGSNSDALAGIRDASFQIGASASLVITDVDGAWTFPYPFDDIATNANPAPTGPYTLTLTVRDNALPDGNAVTRVIPFIIDMTPPVIEQLSHLDEALLLDGAVITGTVRDRYAAVSGVEFAFVNAEAVLEVETTLLHLPFNDLPETVLFDNIAPGPARIFCLDETCPLSGEAGADGRAVRFDGTDDLLRAFEGFDLPESGFSTAFWFNTTCADCGLFSATAAAFPAFGAHDRDIYLADGKICVDVAGAGVETRCTLGDGYADGQWHQVVHTLGASGNALYVDGQPAVSSPTVASSFTAQADLLIGYSPAAGTPFLNGSLDDFVIYEGALSPATVATLYRPWQPADVSGDTWSFSVPDGLEGYYQIDMRAFDSLGNRTELRGDWPQFRGPIDTALPTFDVSAAYRGSGSSAQTLYGVTVRDYNLTTDNYQFVCPLTADQLRYPAGAGELAYSDGTSNRLGEIVARCNRAGFQSSLVAASACDRYGHCAAAVPPQVEAYIGTIDNQILPFGTLPNAIERANLSDPANRVRLLERPGKLITDIAVDTLHGYLYWGERAEGGYAQPGGVWRARLDGSEVQQLVSNLSVYAPEALQIAIDPTGNKLYWTKGHELWWANLDGSLPEVVYAIPRDVPGTEQIGDVAIDPANNALYISERRLRSSQAGYNPSFPNIGVTYKHTLIVRSDLAGGTPEFFAGVGNGCTYENYYDNLGYGIGLGQDPIDCLYAGSDGFDVEALTVSNGTLYWAAVDVDGINSGIYGRTPGEAPFTVAPLAFPGATDRGLRYGPLPQMYVAPTSGGVFVLHDKTIVRGERDGEFTLFTDFVADVAQAGTIVQRSSSTLTAFTAVRAAQTVQTDADLSVEMTSPALVLLDGETAAYNLTLRNEAALPAAGTILTLTLPTGTAFATSDGACNDGGTLVTCDFGYFPALSRQTLAISFTVATDEVRTLTATATIASTTPERTPANNRVTHNTITAAPSLADVDGLPYIYFGDSGKLTRIPLFGDRTPEPVQVEGGVASHILAADPQRGRLYMITADDKLVAINPDGTGRAELANVNPIPLASQDRLYVAVDETSGQLYWSEITSLYLTAIKRANPDGSGVETVVANVRAQKGLLIDPVRGHLYWVALDTQGRRELIYRSNLDGSNPEVVHTAREGSAIRYLALDPYNQKLYWLDPTYGDEGGLIWADSGGGRVTVLLDETSRDARGIIVRPYENAIYYAGYGSIWQNVLAANGSDEDWVADFNGALYAGLSNLNPAVFAPAYLFPPTGNLVYMTANPFGDPPCIVNDTHEPNDTAATAAALDAGSGAVSTTGALCRTQQGQPQDIDHYRIALNNGARMTVTLGSLPADYGLYVMRDGVTVKASVTAGQADERIVIDNYDAAADYTIVVFSATPVINPNPYTLAVALGAAPPQTVFTAEQCLAVDPADAAGLAGNGTQANATPATLGTPVTGALCHQNDIDVYAFDAVAGATLTFDLPQRPADYALQLYRPDGTFVTALTAATYGSRVQIDVTGRWAVAVGAANLTPTLSTYQLLIGDDSCRVGDAYEPNDLLTAPAVLGAPGRVSATLCDDGDSDHFRISAGAGQRLTVNLPATSVAATLRVLDASGREIGRLGSGQQGQFVLPAAGDYTLVVGKTAPGGDSVPYLFQWLLDAPQPVNDRPYLYYTAGMPGRLFRVALDAGRYTAEPIYLSAAQTYAGPAIAADTLRGYLYSFGLGLGNDQIRRNDLLPFDGSGYTVVIANPNPDGVLTPPVALAADELNGRLYWIQPQGGSLSQGSTIWRADSDGSNAVQVVGNGLARNSLVVDSISGRLYWTEDGAIWRGDLDGNDAAIVRAAVAGQPVRDLALDPFAGRLYWIDATRGLLLRANADGSGASTLIAGLDPSARGVALLPLQNALYYSDGDRLMQAALDGSNPVTLRRLNGVYPGPSNLDPAAYHFETIAVPQSSLVIGRGTPVVSPCTLADAHEPNNSAGGATPLSVVTTTVTTGALCNSVPGGPADIDFYQIVVANQTQLTVTLSGLPADYSLSLSDSGGRLLAASVTPGLVDEQVSFANNSGGDATYFVRVGNSGFGNHSPYTLTATIGAAPPPPPDDAACGAVDRYDAPAPGGNGTLAGATDLTLNQALVAALCYADDVDMYRFAGRAEQTIIVDLPVRPADYELTLYNPDGVPYDYPAYGAAVRLDDDGMWTLAVSHSALTPTTAQYQLLVSDTHCIADDSYEPNNDLFSVRPLARGERVRATLCSAADVDIFSVSASSGEQLTINYPLNASGAVVRVEPAAVVSNLGEVTPGGQLVVILPANTDYHIIVENSATVETNVPYEFEVLVGPRPTASSDTPYIYYGRSGDLVRADVVGGDVMPINYPTAFGDSGGRVLAADAGRNLLYVLDPQDRIVRVDPLGQTPTVIVSDTGAASTRPTESLAVDERSRRIYWVHATGSNTGDIRSANGDGSDVQTVISAIGADHGLAIDPLGGRIYWVESGGNPSAESIRRANLDGSGVETIYAAPAGRQIRALTLDPFAQTLYWRDATQGRLLRLPIGGSAETVVNQPDAQGFVLLPLQDTLYYAAADQLWRAALDGSNAVAVTRLDGAYNGIHSAEPDLFAVTTITPPGSNLVLLNSHALAQPCDAVDGYEPNNTPQTARGIGPTTLTAAICSGDVTQPDSFDYYQIVVSPFEQLDVTLSDLPLDYGLSLSLNGVEVAWSNNVGTADERVTHVNRSAQGATYIIAVQGGGQSSRLPYTLQVATAPAPPLPPPPTAAARRLPGRRPIRRPGCQRQLRADHGHADRPQHDDYGGALLCRRPRLLRLRRAVGAEHHHQHAAAAARLPRHALRSVRALLRRDLPRLVADLRRQRHAQRDRPLGDRRLGSRPAGDDGAI